MSNINVAALCRATLMSAMLVPPAFAQEIDRIAAITTASARPTMLVVGERLEYDVKFGKLQVGHGSMEVRERTDVRGRETFHTVFAIRGGIPFFRVDDRLESWIDTRSFTSLRFAQQTNEGRYHRERRVELFPERATMLESGEGAEEQPTVAQPLDEGGLLYFLRTLPLEVGDRYSLNRYFRPDRNPVRLEVVRRERIQVPAGTFETIVIRPTIKSSGIFSENGQAEVWVTDDERRIMVQMTAKLSFGTLHLSLREMTNVVSTSLALRK
ncbi:MAG: DUF3108 domain-containing protein [Gemmatimonadaceae bacterium]